MVGVHRLDQQPRRHETLPRAEPCVHGGIECAAKVIRAVPVVRNLSVRLTRRPASGVVKCRRGLARDAGLAAIEIALVARIKDHSVAPVRLGCRLQLPPTPVDRNCGGNSGARTVTGVGEAATKQLQAPHLPTLLEGPLQHLIAGLNLVVARRLQPPTVRELATQTVEEAVVLAHIAARIARVVERARVVQHLRGDVVKRELGLVVAPLVHELGSRQDRRVGAQPSEFTIEVVDDDVLEPITIHGHAFTSAYPRLYK